MIRDTIERTVIWIGLALFAFFLLYPFWIAIWGGLKTIPQIYDTLVFEPVLHISTEPAAQAISLIWKPMLYSLYIAVLTTLIAVSFGILGGYVLIQGRSRFTNVVLAMVLFAIYIPPVTKLLPTLKIIQTIGLYDTNFAVGLAVGAAMLPMATILYRQFFRRLPKSYWEVNALAGGNHFDALFRVVVPLAKVPTVTVAVLSLGIGWNVFLLPLVLTAGNIMSRPVGVAISMLRTAATEDGSINVMLIGAIIAAIPPVLLYLFGQRYVTSGFRTTGE